MSINRRNFLHQSGTLGAAICLFPEFLVGCGSDNPMNSDTESQFRIDIIFTEQDYEIKLPNGESTQNLNDFSGLFKASLQDIDTEAIENFVIALSEAPAEAGKKRKGRGAAKIANYHQDDNKQVRVPLSNGLELRMSTEPETHDLGGCIDRRVPHFNYALHRPTSDSTKGHDIFNLHVAVWQEESKYCAAFYVNFEVRPEHFDLVLALAKTLFLGDKVEYNQNKQWICVKKCFSTKSERDAWQRQHLSDAFEMVEQVEAKVAELIMEAVIDRSREAVVDVVKLGEEVLKESVKGVLRLGHVLVLGLVGVLVGSAIVISTRQIGILISVIKTVLTRIKI